VNLLTDKIDFDAYFRDHADEGAKVKPASSWADEVIDRFYGQGAAHNWTRTGFDKADGKFDLRPGEVTLWAGVNGHGKTTFLSHTMLNVMREGQKVCIASMEMKPRDTMAKLSSQAAGLACPTREFIRAFHGWTNGKLWIYDHLGRLASSRALAVATYARKEIRVDHIVIDSLMKCGIGVDDLTGQKDFVDGLCAIARDTGLHIHLVVHMRKGEDERKAPGKFDVKGAGEVTDLVDNLVIVWKNLRKPEA
jgi:twinkle protein